MNTAQTRRLKFANDKVTKGGKIYTITKEGERHSVRLGFSLKHGCSFLMNVNSYSDYNHAILMQELQPEIKLHGVLVFTPERSDALQTFRYITDINMQHSFTTIRKLILSNAANLIMSEQNTVTYDELVMQEEEKDSEAMIGKTKIAVAINSKLVYSGQVNGMRVRYTVLYSINKPVNLTVITALGTLSSSLRFPNQGDRATYIYDAVRLLVKNIAEQSHE